MAQSLEKQGVFRYQHYWPGCRHGGIHGDHDVCRV